MKLINNFLNNYKWILEKSSFLALDRIIKLVVNFGLTIALAKYLEPSGFGKFNLILMVTSIVGALTTLGMESILSKQISVSVNEEEKKSFLVSSIGLRLIMSVLILSIFFIVSAIINYKIETYLLIGLMAIVPNSFALFEFYFQGLNKTKTIFLVNQSTFVITTILKLFGIILKLDIDYFASIFFVEFTLIGLFYLFKTKFNKLIFNYFNFSKCFVLFKESWPLFLSTIIVSLYMKVDGFMIKGLLSDQQLGLYSISTRLTEFWYFIPMAIAQASLPVLAKNVKNNEALKKTIISTIRLMLIVSVCFILIFTFLGEFIISNLFGVNYLDSVLPTKILAWSGIMVSFGLTTNNFLIVTSNTRIILYRNISGLIVNLILNFIFIPIYGIVGAAATSLFTQFFINFVLDAFSKKTQILFKFKLNSLNLSKS